MKIKICNAILAIKPDAQVSVFGEDINTLVWHNGNPNNITNQQILDKQSELQALEDVYENRRNEYGTVISQLDEIYHSGLDSWKTRIASIKTKYPKE
jgi:CII-binding regulator of phage lambda lysogenization HflD